MEKIDLWAIERTYHQQGMALICGTDEAGAGPLAGPVYAAAVILPVGLELAGLTDSKKTSEKTRNRLFDEIQTQALAWSVAMVSHEEIDATDILTARMTAMDRAIKSLNPAPQFALVDGTQSRGIACPNVTVKQGDGLSANIAAASILAKVSRDRQMVELGKLYPQYQFEVHKGYGTKGHYAALERYGPSPIHRMTFLKKFLANGTPKGYRTEKDVAP